MKLAFWNKQAVPAEPLEIGLLGAEIPADMMDYVSRDRVAFCAVSAGLRLDEIERRIILIEAQRKNDRFAAGLLPDPPA